MNINITQHRPSLALSQTPTKTFYLTYPKHQPLTSLNFQKGSKLLVAPSPQSLFLFDSQYVILKLLGDDYATTYQELRNSKGEFKDQWFQHSEKSIRKREEGLEIKWKRISWQGDSVGTIGSMKIGEGVRMVEFALALSFLQLKQVLNRNVVSFGYLKRGIAVFKMRRHGVNRIIQIDDYLPMYKNQYLFSQSNEDDYLVPLLEKAMAKLYGCYQNLPKTLPEIFSTLILVPQVVYRVGFDNQQIEKLLDSLPDSWICCCHTQTPPRDYLITKHQTRLLLISQKNQTILTSKPQFFKHITTVWVWRYHPNYNITFEQTNSKSSSYKLQLEQDSDLTLQLSFIQGKGFKRLLVCNEQYEFVACSAEETAGMGQQQQTSLFLGRLPKGVYYVYGEIEKYEGGKQVMTVVAEGVVRIMNWVLPERFMEDVLHSYSRKVNTNLNTYLDSERKSFIALRLMYRQLGMAYIQVFLDSSLSKQIKVQCDYENYKAAGFETRPYGEGKYLKVIRPGEKSIIPFYISYNHPTVLEFPPNTSPVSELPL